MKRVLLLCLMSAMCLTSLSWASVKVAKTIFDTSYNFSIENVNVAKTVLEGQEFSKLSLVGVDSYTGIYYERGMPEIPVIRFYVTANSKEDIQVFMSSDKGAEEFAPLSNEIMPSQDSLPKIKGAKVPFIKFDLDKDNSFWPNKDFQIDEAGSLRGKTRFLITLFPINYNAGSTEYRLVKDFEVRILNAPTKAKANKKETMVFVVGQKFKNSPSVKKYVEFKTLQGFVVKTLVYGEEATDDVTLRKAIQNIYKDLSTDLKYALIIGDIEDVGSHKAANLTKGVTDHYYRAIDTDSYDNDINGPDIGVGRITPKSEDELSKIVTKFINYQSAIFANEEWLKHPAFLATNDKYTVAEGSHNYVIDNYTKPAGYTGIFPENPMIGGDKLYAITYKVPKTTVISALKEGRFLVDYSGHGATTYWDAPNVTQSDVKSFVNAAYPFVIGNACITGDFTIDESFAETWIKNSAIMYWGSMDSSYWDEDDILERAMADKVFKNGVQQLSDVTNYALGAVWKFYNGANRSKYYWETYTIFGDPSIDLRTTVSKTLEISGPMEIAFGEDSITYTVTTDSGAPVANARVAFSLGTKVIAVAQTNASGEVQVKFDDVEVGSQLKLAVFADNARPLFKDVLITSTANPYLVVANYTANGEMTSALRPFDTVKFNFLVKNVAKVPTKGGKIILEAVEGPAQILSKEAQIPALAGGAVYNYVGEEIKIKMLDASACDKVTLKLRWVTQEGQDKIITQTYIIKRATIAVTSVDFGDAANPANGGFGPGDAGKFFVTVKNTGNEKIVNAKLSPVANTCLEKIAGSIVIPALNPGETIRIQKSLDATISSSCKNDDLAAFELKGTYEGLAPLAIASMGNFTVGRYGTFEFANAAVNLAVPDNSSIELPFEVKNVNVLKEITLALKMTHSYSGDMEIKLVSPNGTPVTVYAREGGSTHDIDLNLAPSFTNFLSVYGKSAVGTWKFIFTDTANSDTGTVNSVKVKFKGLI